MPYHVVGDGGLDGEKDRRGDLEVLLCDTGGSHSRGRHCDFGDG